MRACVTRLLIVLTCLLPASLADARVMLSHRAVYSLSTGDLQSGSDVAEVDGRLVVEAIEECDGFILNQRIVTRTTSTQGEETLSDLRMALWESREGDRLRFNIASLINGRLVREDDGDARLYGNPRSGVASFGSDEPASLPLPAGTMFPSTHNLMILRKARGGDRLLPATIFDGSREDGVYDTFTVIGSRRDDSVEARRGQPLLEGVVSWPVRTGYFILDQDQSEPDFEIGYTLFENGVAGDLELDYGDFVIAGRLRSLEELPTPVCTE